MEVRRNGSILPKLGVGILSCRYAKIPLARKFYFPYVRFSTSLSKEY